MKDFQRKEIKGKFEFALQVQIIKNIPAFTPGAYRGVCIRDIISSTPIGLLQLQRKEEKGEGDKDMFSTSNIQSFSPNKDEKLSFL